MSLSNANPMKFYRGYKENGAEIISPSIPNRRYEVFSQIRYFWLFLNDKLFYHSGV